nr:hypothetical protein F32B4.7 - Caenorhabditis elegans [Caenorhabditis elegans]
MLSPKQNMPLESGKLINDLRVSELKVSESFFPLEIPYKMHFLQTELEKRGLSTQGVKVVLTVRLNKVKMCDVFIYRRISCQN